MAVQAVPREVAGVTYQDPISYVVAGGHDREVARAVVNDYKAYYAAKRRGKLLAPSWLDYVSHLTGLAEELCVAIMRRYRAYFGKQAAT